MNKIQPHKKPNTKKNNNLILDTLQTVQTNTQKSNIKNTDPFYFYKTKSIFPIFNINSLNFKNKIKELAVIGYPSRYGGADTELDHQIRCWEAMGIKVHLCHTSPIDTNLKRMQMEDRGCIVHESNDWKSLEGLHCISFCNGGFLKDIEIIKKYVKTTTFVNCMTWNFDKELEAQEKNFIDFHLYQTDHQLEKVSIKLKNLGKNYRPIRFQPYFYDIEFPFKEKRNKEYFQFGRISRADTGKYNPKQIWIYETMVSPIPKKGLILGINDKIKEKIGHIPDWIETYQEGKISQQEFYNFCDVIICATETFENLPRIGFEAMSSGSVLIVDNKGGWKVLVENGKTGWLCNDEKDFVYKSSRTAYENEETQLMRINAKNKLNKEWGLEQSMKSWDNVFSEWEKIN